MTESEFATAAAGSEHKDALLQAVKDVKAAVESYKEVVPSKSVCHNPAEGMLGFATTEALEAYKSSDLGKPQSDEEAQILNMFAFITIDEN